VREEIPRGSRIGAYLFFPCARYVDCVTGFQLFGFNKGLGAPEYPLRFSPLSLVRVFRGFQDQTNDFIVILYIVD
jgi:hypothetical protein